MTLVWELHPFCLTGNFKETFFAIHVSAGSGLLLALDLKMNGIIRPDLIGIPDFDGRPV